LNDRRELQIVERANYEEEALAEIIDGLSGPERTLPCKLFYDRKGSLLFERICEQPEYYLTRTELQIMERHAQDIARQIGPDCVLIEYGCGACYKVRLLLDALRDPVAYIPIDISADHLAQAATGIERAYPKIDVLPLCADYTQPHDLPLGTVNGARRIVYFPGSTIGNFTRAEATSFLRNARHVTGTDGGILIGVDLDKNPRIVKSAYNDAEGVTARFNLNILTVLNREFDANFDLDQFEHVAVYDRAHQRIEMRLISRCRQDVTVAGRRFEFDRGEVIVTEHSHKYTLERFARIARDAGLHVHRVWTDPDAHFSVQLLEEATG